MGPAQSTSLQIRIGIVDSAMGIGATIPKRVDAGSASTEGYEGVASWRTREVELAVRS